MFPATFSFIRVLTGLIDILFTLTVFLSRMIVFYFPDVSAYGVLAFLKDCNVNKSINK